MIAILAFILALAGIALYRMASTVALQKAGFFGAIAMSIITITAIASSVYMYNRSTSSRYAIVMTDKAPVSRAPRIGEKNALFRLADGVKVEIVDSLAGKQYGKMQWYKIETNDERSGWMQKADIEKI